jgi:hypothetical protein
MQNSCGFAGGREHLGVIATRGHASPGAPTGTGKWQTRRGRPTVSDTALNVTLAQQGFPEPAQIFANLGTAPLVEHAIRYIQNKNFEIFQIDEALIN